MNTSEAKIFSRKKNVILKRHQMFNIFGLSYIYHEGSLDISKPSTH